MLATVNSVNLAEEEAEWRWSPLLGPFAHVRNAFAWCPRKRPAAATRAPSLLVYVHT